MARDAVTVKSVRFATARSQQPCAMRTTT
jgi:hypothetical protein